MRTQPLSNNLSQKSRGFTLVELLVVIALIAILISTVLVSMRGIRGAADRARTSNALREIIMGYSAYSRDFNMQLMPGGISADDFATPAQPNAPFDIVIERGDVGVSDGTEAGGYGEPLPAGDIGSYVWRLMPYVDNQWKIFLEDYASSSVVERIDNEINSLGVYGAETRSGAEDLGLGFAPSFGLNAVYLGGNSLYGNAELCDTAPWRDGGSGAATSVTEVKNPAHIVVFAPSVIAGQQHPDGPEVTLPGSFSNETLIGSAEIRPPYTPVPAPNPWQVLQWRHNNNNGRWLPGPLTSYSNGGGWPVIRNGGDKIPISHIDGSVETVPISELYGAEPSGASAPAEGNIVLMKRWYPRYTGYGKSQE